MQEHRWAGRTLANQTHQLQGKDSVYKFLLIGISKGPDGAGILLAENSVDKVFNVERVSYRTIFIKLVLDRVAGL